MRLISRKRAHTGVAVRRRPPIVEQAVHDYVAAANAVDRARHRNSECGCMVEELETLGPLVAVTLVRGKSPRRARLSVDGFAATRMDGDTATIEAVLSRADSAAPQKVRFRLARSEGVWKVCSTDEPIA